MKTYILFIVFTIVSTIGFGQPPAPLDTNALSTIAKEKLKNNEILNYIHSKEAITSDLVHLLNHDSHQVRFQIFRLLHLRENTPSPVDIVKKHINDNPEATFIRSCQGNDGILDTYIMMLQRGHILISEEQKDSLNLILLTQPNELVSKYRCFVNLKSDNKQALALAKKMANEEEIVSAIVPLAKYDFDANKKTIIKLLKKWLYTPAHAYLPHRYHSGQDLRIFFHYTKMDNDIYQIMINYKENPPNNRPNNTIISAIDEALQQRADFDKTLELQKQFYALDNNNPNAARAIFQKLKTYIKYEHVNDPFFEDFYFDLWKIYGLSNYKTWSILERNRKTDLLNHLYSTLPSQISNITSNEDFNNIKYDIKWYIESERDTRVTKIIFALNHHSDSIVKAYSLQQASLWVNHHRLYQKEIINLLLNECKNDDKKFHQYLFSFIIVNQDFLNKEVIAWYERYGKHIEDDNVKKHVEETIKHISLIEK